MQKFVYQVVGFEWEDTEAFGQAWKTAKEVATGMGVPIYRLVINGEKVKQEVYHKAGCFLRVDMVKPENYRIF